MQIYNSNSDINTHKWWWLIILIINIEILFDISNIITYVIFYVNIIKNLRNTI